MWLVFDGLYALLAIPPCLIVIVRVIFLSIPIFVIGMYMESRAFYLLRMSSTLEKGWCLGLKYHYYASNQHDGMSLNAYANLLPKYNCHDHLPREALLITSIPETCHFSGCMNNIVVQ